MDQNLRLPSPSTLLRLTPFDALFNGCPEYRGGGFSANNIPPPSPPTAQNKIKSANVKAFWLIPQKEAVTKDTEPIDIINPRKYHFMDSVYRSPCGIAAAAMMSANAFYPMGWPTYDGQSKEKCSQISGFLQGIHGCNSMQTFRRKEEGRGKSWWIFHCQQRCNMYLYMICEANF